MNARKRIKLALSLLLVLGMMLPAAGFQAVMAPEGQAADVGPDMRELWEAFETPALELKSRPLWFWNARGQNLRGLLASQYSGDSSLPDAAERHITEIMERSKEESGYYGFGILPNWINDYLSEDYFALYGHALSEAKRLGLKLCLYDENGFPSGSINLGSGNNGLLRQEYPEHTYKRLVKGELDVGEDVLDRAVSVEIPAGDYRTYMGAIAWNRDTDEIVDISDNAIIIDDSPDALWVAGPGASSIFTSASGYEADKAFTDDNSQRWNGGDSSRGDEWVGVKFEDPVTLDKAYIVEPWLQGSYRIQTFSLQLFDSGTKQWVDSGVAPTVDPADPNQNTGAGRIRTYTYEFPSPVTVSGVRFYVHTATGNPSIRNFELYNGAARIAIPAYKTLEAGSRVEYTVPAGDWKLMTFATVADYTSSMGTFTGKLVDYLSEDAVDKFIELTFDAYYEHFPEYFGDVIDSVFFDEPPIYHANGHTWTGKFNAYFEEKYGYNPIIYYPSLFYGDFPDVQAARNILHSFRADLFAENYIKNINDWCNAHGIQLTGHMDQEEVVNPVSTSTDMIKAFKYQDIPGHDQISSYDRSRRSLKLVSSSAYNYDKQKVMTEIFGAFGSTIATTTLEKEAMDAYAKGINLFVPHAIWSGSSENPPELSYRTSRYAGWLPGFNDFSGRMSALVRDGGSQRHVADIGVLYPINALQASYWFQAGYNAYNGGHAPPEADYMDVGDYLSTTIRRDFTFLHPETLAGNVSVVGNKMRLDNEINYEDYKVFLLTGGETISLAALQKIKAFYDAGGKVIATTKLPSKSSEVGRDAEVQAIIDEMFDVKETHEIKYSASSFFQNNTAYAAANAFNGRTGSGADNVRWNSGDQTPPGSNWTGFVWTPEWLAIDFGMEVTLNKTVIQENFGRMTSYRIQKGDGLGNWEDVVVKTNLNAPNGSGNYIETRVDEFPEITTQYLRLYIDGITARIGSISVTEFEVYDNDGTKDGVNLARFAGMPEPGDDDDDGDGIEYNENGGCAVFLGTTWRDTLEETLDKVVDAYDVWIDSSIRRSNSNGGGNFSYLHKVNDGHDVYYFANSSNTAISTDIVIRKDFKKPMIWDPHTGTRSEPASFTVKTLDSGEKVTEIRLDLPAIHSLFIVDEGIDWTALQAAIEAFEALNKSDYTAASWAGAEIVYNAAVQLGGDGDATLEQVAAAALALTDAIKDLEEAVLDFGAGQPAALTLKRGQTYQIKIQSNNKPEVQFFSANGNVSLSPSGLVTGVKPGIAIITVVDTWSGQFFNIVINVTN